MARPGKSAQFTTRKKGILLRELRRTGNITISSKIACVSRRWTQKLIARDPEFKAAVDLAVYENTEQMLEEARRRAYEGVEEPVFYQGNVCGHVRKYSDTLLMFKIKGERPEYATERREISGRDGSPLQAQIQAEHSLAPDDMQMFLQAMTDAERRKGSPLFAAAVVMVEHPGPRLSKNGKKLGRPRKVVDVTAKDAT